MSPTETTGESAGAATSKSAGAATGAAASKRAAGRGGRLEVGRSRASRPGLSGLADGELEEWLVGEGEPAYRARQIRDAMWHAHAASADEMRTLPAGLRSRLEKAFRIDTIARDEVRTADGGKTEKTLHLLADGAAIESVLMRYPARGFDDRGRPVHRERNTLCVSSQAGCAVGCPFCATGELGFGRDLETAEILDQVRHAARRLAAAGRRLTNIVFMGMGEPLLNLDRVLAGVAILSDPRQLGLGERHVVVSTAGVVPGMRRLSALAPQLTLAVSLHSARDPLRDVLVPLNRRWPVAEVVAAARDYARATGRRVSYEYVMISGVNDTVADADALARLLRGELAHVNLIPMNQVAHTPWGPSTPERVAQFAARVRHGGVGVTVRANRGQDAGAACGQLAADRAGEPAAPAVARRREEIVRQSEAALLGRRSPEALPAGLDSAISAAGPR